jgi:predicted XRE-type DNA-binding protein
MATKFNELKIKLSPEAQKRAEALYSRIVAEMPLSELRRARGLSQKALAEVLHIDQPSVSKMERRTDMYISTLRSHIEAMGGELEIIAHFPDGAVQIKNFTGIGQEGNADQCEAKTG